MSVRLQAIFFGHGNPVNAASDTEVRRCCEEAIAKPKAALCIPAQWYVPGTGVTVFASPRTIHDFVGFPSELCQVQCLAPGDPDLARRVQTLLKSLPVSVDNSWCLDHGTCSVLRYAYPEADVPWSNRASTKRSLRHSTSRSESESPRIAMLAARVGLSGVQK